MPGEILSKIRTELTQQSMCRKRNPPKMTKVMLSDTEKAVALRHEESEDLALIYKPHDEANERLKAKVLLNFSRKFDVSSLHADRSRPGLDSAQVMGMSADEPHAAEDVMENGCEALDAPYQSAVFCNDVADHCARRSGHVRRRTLCQGDPRAGCRCTVCCDLAQDGGTGRFLSQTGLPLLVARRPSTSTWTLGDWRIERARSRRVVLGHQRHESQALSHNVLSCIQVQEDREGQFSETDDCESEARSSDDGALTADDLRVFVEWGRKHW